MWQDNLIRSVPSPLPIRHPPPRRRVYTPTPDDLERFFWAWLVLSRGEAHGRERVDREARPGPRDHGG